MHSPGHFPQPLPTGCLGSPGSTKKAAVGDGICDSARNFHPVCLNLIAVVYSEGHGNEEWETFS